MSAEAEGAKAGGARQGREGRSLAEWVSFGVAAAILAAVAGLVIYLWATAPDTEPALTVEQGAVRAVGGQFYVPFTVTNTGGRTAESVVVQAELAVGGETVAEGAQEFSFLAGGEAEGGAFIFDENPRAGELRLRAAAYSLP